jgi:hypothetical protein
VEKFLRVENFRRPNRQMHMAFDLKREFGRSADFSLSGTIGMNWSIFSHPLAVPRYRHDRKLPSAE